MTINKWERRKKPRAAHNPIPSFRLLLLIRPMVCKERLDRTRKKQEKKKKKKKKKNNNNNNTSTGIFINNQSNP